jgi:hypothetical protein
MKYLNLEYVLLRYHKFEGGFNWAETFSEDCAKYWITLMKYKNLEHTLMFSTKEYDGFDWDDYYRTRSVSL